MTIDGRRQASRRRAGEVVQCLGELFRSSLEGEVELDLFVDDLLLEQRGEDDSRRASGDESADHLEVSGQGPRGRHDGRAQLQAEVAGREIGHASGPSEASVAVTMWGTVRSTIASWE